MGYPKPSGELPAAVLDEAILLGWASSLARKRPDAIALAFQGMSLQHMLVPQD
jgi:hypothetical protein